MMRGIGELKRRLIERDDPGDLLADFAGGLGMDPEFLSCGTRIQHPLLDQVVVEFCREVFGGVNKTRLVLQRIEEHAFVHGVVLADRRSGAVLYFEDVMLGALVLSPGVGRSASHVARFSGYLFAQEAPTQPG